MTIEQKHRWPSTIVKMDSDELIKRTKIFAHQCVKSALQLPNNYVGNHIRGQLIKCSTSVAANYRAVCVVHSKASYIAKLSIVIEETDETYFCLEFIKDERLIDTRYIKALLNESDQLKSIFMTSRKTARKKSA